MAASPQPIAAKRSNRNNRRTANCKEFCETLLADVTITGRQMEANALFCEGLAYSHYL